MVDMADEPVTPTFVADALGKSFNSVKKTMWEMSRDGHLSSSGNGGYTLVTNNPGNPREQESTSPVTQVTEPPEEPNGHLWPHTRGE